MPNTIRTGYLLKRTCYAAPEFCCILIIRSILTNTCRSLCFLTLFLIAFQLYVPRTFALELPDEVVVGVPKNFPPHHLINEKTGEPDGFGIDVIEHIAGMAGLSLKYIVYDTWGDLNRALKEGRVDIIPNMGITAERNVFFDFTSPVETFQIRIFVRSTTSDIQNVNDLAGRHVAVVETNKGRFILEERSGIRLQMYPSIEEALLALLSGKADALVFPDAVINWFTYKSGLESKIKIVGESLLEVKRAIAVRKGLPELLERLDAEVEVFIRSPEFMKIYTRWHSEPEPYWSVRRVTIVMGMAIAFIVLILMLWRYSSIMRINRVMEAVVKESEKTNSELEKVNEAHQKDKDILKLRTDELYLKVDEVEKMNKAFVGRELKMKELKKEIEELKKKEKS